MSEDVAPQELALSPVGEALADGASKLRAFWVSVVRTFAPKVVIAVLTWIAVQTGFEVSAETTIVITVTVVGLLEGLWYIIARSFEQWGAQKGWSWLVKIGGIMLFVPKPPAYTPPQAAALIVNDATKK